MRAAASVLLGLILIGSPAWGGTGTSSTSTRSGTPGIPVRGARGAPADAGTPVDPSLAPHLGPLSPPPELGPIVPPPVPTGPEVWVKLHDQRVFALRLGKGELTVEARARNAGRALEAAAADLAAGPEPRIVPDGELVVLYLGESPIVQLSVADALAAEDVSLAVHAKTIAVQINDAIEQERTRSQIANAVFSLSLLVFAGLIAFLLLRRFGQLSELAHRFIEGRPEGLPGLSLSGIEVLSPAMVRATVVTGISIGTRLAQVAIVYLWLLVSLSLFERTRDTAARLRELLLGPLGQLLGRFGRALPLIVVLVLAALLVLVLVRFVGLFFASVERGETRLSWLPTELAGPTSVLLRFSMLLAFLVLAAPLILGSSDLVSSMVGIVSLMAIGLASTPLLATASVGIVAIFGRRYRVGDFIELGTATGRIRRLSLLELGLEDENGMEVRVPHLVALFRGIKVHGRTTRASALIMVDPGTPLAELETLFLEVAAGLGERPEVSLESLDKKAARFRVSVRAADPVKTRTALYSKIAARLKSAGHALGEAAGPP